MKGIFKPVWSVKVGKCVERKNVEFQNTKSKKLEYKIQRHCIAVSYSYPSVLILGENSKVHANSKEFSHDDFVFWQVSRSHDGLAIIL